MTVRQWGGKDVLYVGITQPFFLSTETCTSPARTSFIKYSPAAQIPADHKSNMEVMQKKLIDWPISSQEPVSCTLKKKVKVIPTTKRKIIKIVWATQR